MEHGESAMSTRRARLAGAGLLVASLSLTACSAAGGGAGGLAAGATSATGAPLRGGSATFAVDSPFLGFDPNVTPAAQDARVLRQVFDSLLYLDSDHQLQPWLAKAWKVSTDRLVYTFTLRSDVVFHDGTPFNAKAVCFNLDRIKAPQTASIYAIGLIGPYKSCTAPSPTTAVVTMSAPFAPFLNNLTSPFMGINSPTAAAAMPPEKYSFAPVGSGPFRFVSYTPNDRVRLERYDKYAWPPGNARHTGPAYLNELTFQVIPDPTVRMGSVRNGSVNGASNAPEEQVAAIKSDRSLTFIVQAQSGAPYQLHLNTGKPPFNELAARKAVQQALDIDSAIRSLYMGVRTRAWGPLTPSTIGYTPAVEGSFRFDPSAAKATLAAAGWVEGPDGVRVKNGRRLTVTYVESAPNREKRQDLATLFKANLKEVGFDVNLVFGQPAQLTTVQQQGSYDIAGLSLVAVDPNVLYQMYDPTFIPAPGRSGFNLSRTDEPAISNDLAQGQRIGGDKERAAAYAAVQKRIVAQARSIAIYVPSYTVVLHGLQGLRFDAEGYPIFYDAYLTK